MHRTGRDHCFFWCLHSLWTGKWLGNQNSNVSVWFCTTSVICFSTCSCLSSWKQMTPHTCSSGNMCLQTTISCVLKLDFVSMILITQRWSNFKILWVLCAFFTVGRVMWIDGDLVVRSDKVQLQCIKWINVKPQNVLCAEVLAAVQGLHSSHSLSGPH